MPKPDRLEQARLDKLAQIVELGHDPFGQRFDGKLAIADARTKCPEESGVDGEAVRVAGRLMLRRKAGKLRFYVLKDATGSIQLLFSRGDLSEEQWALMSALDLGDLVGVDGRLRRTDSGEISVFVTGLTVLCKALAPPPEKHAGVTDDELRLRHRSLDLIYTDGVLETQLARTKVVASVRKTLADRGFVEVETPVLHNVAGGAAARPFTTHHNALDIDLFLRIALELHLKRLMVGGIEKVFEIGRVFRNEGIDATHNPEFTMMEVYEAYGDYTSMMDLVEAVFVEAAKAVGLEGEGGAITAPWGDATIDLTPPFDRRGYHDLVREHAGVDPADADAVAAKAAELKIDTAGVHPDIILNKVFEETVEDRLGFDKPVFVTDYPASICPLTKRKRGDESIAERFELFVRGTEMANAYTELNDPRLQEELFTTQLAGQDEEDSMAKLDREFLQALKIGMPPAGGLGIGIDRLAMLLTDSKAIKDVILFPTLKPNSPHAELPEPSQSEWIVELIHTEETGQFFRSINRANNWEVLSINKDRSILSHKEFTQFTSPTDVRDYAKDFAHRLSATFLSGTGRPIAITVGNAHRRRGKKWEVNAFVESVVNLREELTCEIVNRDGSGRRTLPDGSTEEFNSSREVTKLETPADRACQLVERIEKAIKKGRISVETSDRIGHVCRLVSGGDLGFVNSYRIYELIKQDLSPEKLKNITSENEATRFKRSANHPTSGDLARHAVSSEEPHPNPMSPAEASEYARRLTLSWLSVISALSDSTTPAQ